MFKLTIDENDFAVLEIELPMGKTQDQILEAAQTEICAVITDGHIFGHHVRINGRCTTALALFLGHKLAHFCKSVSIFDPKMNEFVLSVWH